MIIAFTICSYNYSALAFELFHSLREHNPEIKFVLALVDTKENFLKLQEKTPEGFNLLLVDSKIIQDYEELQKRYSVLELNTAVKPFVFEHLFSENPSCASILYFDPDISIYDSLSESLLVLFDNYDFILTPHMINPRMEDKFAALELHLLNHGVFNLGFLGLKRSESVAAFLHWWKFRLRYWCYADVYSGLFTDQIWINFVPLFYEKVKIFKHWGANVAHWNLLERELIKINGKYYVNNENYPLLFYHFSSFTHFAKELDGSIPFSKFPSELDKRQPLANEIIVDYQKRLIAFGHIEFFGNSIRRKNTSLSLKGLIKNYFLKAIRKRGFELIKTMKYYKIKKFN